MSNDDSRPLIALVSAVPAAIGPAEAAFAEVFPAARVWNILDDRLLQSADEVGGVTPELAERMARLIRHAAAEGADGILVTCSIYGTAAHAVANELGITLLGADDAAFESALTSGYRSVLLISPAAGPLADSQRRLDEAVLSAGGDMTVVGTVATGAAEAARAGDIDALAARLHEAYLAADTTVEAILLGQFSISPGAAKLAELTGLPVLATPQRAALALRSALDTEVSE